MIEFDGIPTLSDPVMIAAFEGWNDAGESASATITQLREVWGAELITEFDSEELVPARSKREFDTCIHM